MLRQKIKLVCILNLIALNCYGSSSRIEKQIQSFVDQRVEILDCNISKTELAEFLYKGFARIGEINPALVAGILEKKAVKSLKIQCDLTLNVGYPEFNSATSTIHIWKKSSNNLRIQSTTFHEFLHYVKLPFDLDVHEGSVNLEKDPVYACQAVGFPEFAERLFGDRSKLEVAKDTCGNKVSFCPDIGKDTICWNPN